MAELLDDTEIKSGLFFEDLNRSTKDVLRARASQILLDTREDYVQEINDLKRGIRNLKSDLKVHTDLSPISKDALTFQNSFKSRDWVKEDITLTTEIARKELYLAAVQKRFEELYN